jgi:transcription elongation factor/antiterminator RfaH
MKAWYVASVQPHQEERADQNLRRQGFESWLPRTRRSRRHARRIDMILAPFFPGYLFVRLNCELERWRSINGTRGVRHLLCQDGRPAQLPAGFVESLRDSADVEGLLTVPAEALKVGEPVRLASGPFADYVGTLVRLTDQGRVTLLLKLLGRDVVTLVPRGAVAPAF